MNMERFCIYDLRTVDRALFQEYPLYEYFCIFGSVVLKVWAAVNGCDWSASASGISGMAEKTVMQAFKNMKQKFSVDGAQVLDVSLADFAAELKNAASNRVRLSTADITAELEHIVKCFDSDGQFHDEKGTVLSTSGAVILESSRSTLENMNGKQDPKTGDCFTVDQQAILDEYDPSNALHKSKIRSLPAAQLPTNRSSVYDCTGSELKPMVLARGGSVTSHAGQLIGVDELKKVAAGYLALEKEVPSRKVFYDRNPQTNGIFTNIDTKHGSNVSYVLAQVIASGEFSGTHIQTFLKDVQKVHQAGKFTSDTDKIILEAPELTSAVIQRTFVHAGYSKQEKKLGTAYQRALDTSELTYHANADVIDKEANVRYLYIISKAKASYRKAEKTRKKTDAGEKPLSIEYLNLLRCIVEPTTESSHGHTLGIVTCVDMAYCFFCKAGGTGRCLHISESLFIQLLHWGPGGMQSGGTINDQQV